MADTETHTGADAPDLSLIICTLNEGVAIRGVIEEISVIRHMLGQENWQPRRIASVRVKDGPLMTVGLVDDAPVGATIELFEEGTAPFGRRRAP